ncbi:WRKY family transcription factor [Striga asiatica]|uniref:WRKY family transcription factor n=1 Tax=Striga asiatica TaxID=4170 RepID=A0A5A7P7D9_STRAF|nr:WRKY family transcription factor [Striga asiatica]
MWQVLVAAAAAAGSGLLAKKLILNPSSGSDQNVEENVQNDDALEENQSLGKTESFRDGGRVFRFSSPDWGTKELKRASRNGFRGVKKNRGLKRGKKKWAADGSGENEAAASGGGGNGVGKKVSVCLKKRRIGRHVGGKCESCASKDNTFGWGVSVGIMYMMSAGNAEISRMNCTIDETAKTVHELKAEISRRKSSLDKNKTFLAINCDSPSFTKFDGKRKVDLITLGPALVEENECGGVSSFKEDEQPEVMEMDRLEAEFESELQKLCSTGASASGSEEKMAMFEDEALTRQYQIKNFEHLNSFEGNGVLPTELDEKLRNLLLEQQENHIVELEAELQDVHSKLNEKEAELKALKDCVKRLTQFSLTNASDEETENHEEGLKARTDGVDRTVEFESTELTVGMKRNLGFDSYICSEN